MKKCESCLYKYRIKYLEKENKQLQDNLNKITIEFYNKLVINHLLNDKIETLEKEIAHKINFKKIN